MDTRFVTISAAAAESGVPAWRLRSWEKSGLLTPSRTASGYRVYSGSDIERASQLSAQLAADEQLSPLGLAHASAQGLDPLPHTPPTEPTSAASPAEYQLLRRVAHELRAGQDLRAALRVAVGLAAEFLRATAWSVGIAGSSREQASSFGSAGLSREFTSLEGPWKRRQGFGGQVYELSEPVSIPDLTDVARVGRDLIAREGVRAYAGVPLIRGPQRIGILEVFRHSPEPFSVDQLAVLEVVASFLTPHFEALFQADQLAELRQERSRHFRSLVSQLSSTARQQHRWAATELRLLSDGVAEMSAVPNTASAQIAGALTALAQRFEAQNTAEFDLVELVSIGIVGPVTAKTGIQCRLEVSDWPETMSASLTSRLYLLLSRIVEELTPLTRSSLTIGLSCSATEIHLDLAYDPRPAAEVDAYLASAETVALQEEIGGSVTSTRGPADATVNIVVPRGHRDQRADLLTLRERETLEALDSAETNREIAARLDISSKTLQNHLTSIYRKLQVSSRSEAVAFLHDSPR